ncbi:MAG: hypothetical protein G01um101417_667 [Parcubacteria group bacterium Gr01-1014_17]|nr:MAG: hypothetical protein G01um101417_667 [Parcubacteria group bacterium Gr01-1014_17]
MHRIIIAGSSNGRTAVFEAANEGSIPSPAVDTNMLKDENIEEKLDWYRGKILSGASEIEKSLGWRLRTYFFPTSNINASIFYQSILNASYFTFERKIALYQKIPYFKKLRNYAQVINSLRFIQKLRNELAHWELLGYGTKNRDEIIIYNPVTFKKRRLNKRIIEEFIAHDKRLLKFFGWNYKLESKYGIKNKNISNSRTIEIREFARLLRYSKRI